MAHYGRFNPGKGPGTGWVGFGTVLGGKEKSHHHGGSNAGPSNLSESRNRLRYPGFFTVGTFKIHVKY
jgi:hypothetical protein